MGGVFTLDDPANVPMGISPNCKNVQFSKTGVRSRDGIQKAISLGNAYPITGLSVLTYRGVTGASDIQIPLIFDGNGGLWRENPVGSGMVIPITSSLVTPPANSSMQAALAYNRAYLAFSDLEGTGLRSPAAFDAATLNLDPVAGHLFGEAWSAGSSWGIGDFICPTVPNGHTYRVSMATVIPANAPEPIWPLGVGNGVDITGAGGPANANENTFTVADSATLGNVCAGLHYITVLFQNRNGYISGMGQGAVLSWTAVGGFRAAVSNLPIGPANTLRRIVCITPAAGSNAGPIFYLPKNDTVSLAVAGLNETISIISSVVNDNTSTSVTFNFHDIYLDQANEVTDNFRKIRVPACNDIQYLPTLNRMAYIKPNGFSSRTYLSEPADAETVFGDTNFLDIADSDGQIMVTWREWKGTVYAFKNNSAYVVDPATNTPNTWSAKKAWDKVGAIGPRAVDVGKDFMIFAHKSGVYKFDGGSPGEPLSKDINKLWQGINWDVGHLINVVIDEDNYEIRFLVPYGQSTAPDKQFLFYYGDGWQEPVTISLYGREMAAHQGRKWSGPDDIPANIAIKAERSLGANANAPTNKSFANTQILLGASDPTGQVNLVQPGTMNDNGAGFLATYDTDYAGGGALQQGGSSSGIFQCAGAALTIKGTGNALVSIFGNGYKQEFKMRPATLDSTGYRDYKSGVSGAQSERFLLRVTNGADPNSSFFLNKATIYQRPLFSSR